MKENDKIVKFNQEVSDLKWNEQLSCDGCIYHNTLNDDLCGSCGIEYKNKTTT